MHKGRPREVGGGQMQLSIAGGVYYTSMKTLFCRYISISSVKVRNECIFNSCQ